jgi:hypothetical protein
LQLVTFRTDLFWKNICKVMVVDKPKQIRYQIKQGTLKLHVLCCSSISLVLGDLCRQAPAVVRLSWATSTIHTNSYDVKHPLPAVSSKIKLQRFRHWMNPW